MNSMDHMFNAKSVAVIGASGKPEKTGHVILKNIIDGGFRGGIYPINPKEEKILGYKCYKSVTDVPGDVDLIVVVVPARFVPKVMEEAGLKKVKGSVIISGGFREVGNVELEEQVVGTARKYGIRIIGPNCQGFNYTPNKLCATWPLITKKGPIAVISQSGTAGATLEMLAEDEQLGVSAFVALGNKSDVSEIDLIDYFSKDTETRVISLYIEGVKDGPRFMEIAKKAAQTKPVVVLKPGRTEKGKKAAESHTKSIGGMDQIFEGVCKQLGIVRANDLTEFYDYSKALGFLKKPKGNNMLIATSSGGCGIIATDTAEECGINIVDLQDSLRKRLKEILPDQCVISNPLDLTGDATAQRYRDAMEIAIEDPNIDIFMLIFGDPIPGAFEVVKELKSKTDKPIVISYLGGGQTEHEETEKMHKNGIPVFPTPERAVRAMKAILSVKTTS
jgi:acetyl coenzyme A synthetase (ADP forming)-like protein